MIRVRILVSVQTKSMNKLREYIQLSYEELMNKVSWPTWEDLQESTIIVMIASLLIALLIGVIDLASSTSLGLFYQLFQS